MSFENFPAMFRQRGPSFTKAPALPAGPHKRYIYLQGRIASMGCGRGTTPFLVSRHEVLLRITANGELFDFEAGTARGSASAVALPPAQPHLVRCFDANCFITLAVNPLHPRFRDARAALADRVQVLNPSRFAHLSSRMGDACNGRLRMKGFRDLMDDMLDVLLAGAPAPPPLDVRIFEVMQKLALNIDQSFEHMAADLNLSPSRLSHLFSSGFGLSFRSFQSWARLRQAWRMLVQRRDLNVTEVAHALGFADSAHLARSFRAAFGFPPSALRDPRIFEYVTS